MKTDAQLLRALSESLRKTRSAWKSVRKETTEPSVHDFRVSVRRLMAATELVRAVFGSSRAPSLEQELRRALRRTGRLRDLHVQMETLKVVPENDATRAFRTHLERKALEEIDDVRRSLKRSRRERVATQTEELRRDCRERSGVLDAGAVRHLVVALLREKEARFREAQRVFKPGNEDSMHAMRIALKTFRYVVEAAAAVLPGGGLSQEVLKMQKFQRLLGEARDVEILTAHLRERAESSEVGASASETLARLKRRRGLILGRIVRVLPNAVPDISIPLRPVREKTAVATRQDRRVRALLE